MLDQKARFFLSLVRQRVYFESGECYDVKCILADKIVGSTLVYNVAHISDDVSLACNSCISYRYKVHATMGLIIKMTIRAVTIVCNEDASKSIAREIYFLLGQYYQCEQRLNGKISVERENAYFRNKRHKK